MADTIRIQMMDEFLIYINETRMEALQVKSRKGAQLVQYLILHRGQPVPNQRLLSTLWTEEGSSNPENALKTLVSRLRVILNQLSPGLGACIVADRGAYHWQCMDGMTIDLYEIDRILEELAAGCDDARRLELSDRLLRLYTGDLLQNSAHNEWALAEATALHNRFASAIYAYVERLKDAARHEDVVAVCRKALEVDNFDDRLHLELVSALTRADRTNEALMEYKHIAQLNYRYLGVQPSEELQRFYKQLVSAGRSLDVNLRSIRAQLREKEGRRGAFVCEYPVFRQLYNLQMRNFERLGASMFLGIVMIRPYDGQLMDNMQQDNIMADLLEILTGNLREGDVITRFAPNTYAMLLPTVNYATGKIVMERIKQLFYRRYPSMSIVFEYRVGPLSDEEDELPNP